MRGAHVYVPQTFNPRETVGAKIQHHFGVYKKNHTIEDYIHLLSIKMSHLQPLVVEDTTV